MFVADTTVTFASFAIICVSCINEFGDLCSIYTSKKQATKWLHVYNIRAVFYSQNADTREYNWKLRTYLLTYLESHKKYSLVYVLA